MSEKNYAEGSNLFSPAIPLVSLLGGFAAVAMMVSLFAATTLNARALYLAEIRSMDVFLNAFRAPTDAALIFAAWWVPIAICIAAFAIVAGGLVIVNLTTWVQDALAEINRLSRLCPTLPIIGFPFNRFTCYSQLASLYALVVTGLGLFFISFAVVMINVIVIIQVLI